VEKKVKPQKPTLQERQHSKFQLIKQAFQVYKSIYGHLLIPRTFIVAKMDIRFPEEFRGRPLGQIVSNIRQENLFTSYKDELIAMGFIYKVQEYEINRLFQAIREYKEIYGHVNIHRTFWITKQLIDNNENDNGGVGGEGKKRKLFSKELRGMELGKSVMRISRYGAYEKHAEEFQALGLTIVTVC